MAKRELQKWIQRQFPENQFDPTKPIVTFIGRFDSKQKGLDKLEEAIDATQAAGGQFIVMGCLEDQNATKLLDSLQEKYKNTVLFIRDYKDANGRLHYQQGDQERPGCASLIRASSDFIYIPSKFEPCGLVQFEGWLFGSLAIGSDVGGLADTIISPEKDACAFNGYLFNRDDKKNCAANTIQRAIETFVTLSDCEKGALAKRLIEQGRQYSWTTSPVGLSPIDKYRLVYAQAKKLSSRRSQIQKPTANILERLNQIRNRIAPPHSKQRETNLKEEAYLKYLSSKNPQEEMLEKLFLDLPVDLRTQVPLPYGRTCKINLHKSLGAHQINRGFRFGLDAPNAKEVNLVLVAADGTEKKLPMIQDSKGIWRRKVIGISPGSFYQYEVNGVRKLDPYGKEVANHPAPENAPCSVAVKSNYRWKDAQWMKEQVKERPADKPISITEIHPLIWKKKKGGYLNYRELAPLLVEHCKNAGFTHVELMGILEHPDVRSWGYQVSGFFAPTNRMGSSDDFKFLVDHLHSNNIGVILDWIPAHFCRDSFGLAHLDGSNQYQPCGLSAFFAARTWLYQWGTYFFDFRKQNVRNFLYSSAMYWIKEMHIDGLRVDAVKSILLSENGNEGAKFFKNLNTQIHREFPHVMTIAEDYSSRIDTTSSPAVGGLGFDFKWNIGWKNHVLDYFSLAPHDRKKSYKTITKAVDSDKFHKMILAISHDDLQKSAKALIAKTPDLSNEDKYSNLRAFFGLLTGMPGKKLMFTGSEIGSDKAFDTLFDQENGLFDHAPSEIEEKNLLCLQKLNKIYKSERSLWESDDNGHDLVWIENDDPERRIHAYRRVSEKGGSVACIHNFSKEKAKNFFVPLQSKEIEKELQEEALLIKGEMNVSAPHHLIEFEKTQLELLSGYPHLIKSLKSQKLMDKYYSALFLKNEKLSKFLAQNHINMPAVSPREIFNSDSKEFGGSGICNENIEAVFDSTGKALGYRVQVPPLSTLFIKEQAYSPVASGAPASSAGPCHRGS
ncbi:alpha-amylase family glycosyl hydrolase [Estrella lausannensis]|uniref:1,4-alpha-glucan branching enzyme n=1 Tax=Estrella lausannensis TaxID=483423 RepID=A0A0H5DNW4_9BACT|nr:alpha-amylase family glycosyl hydrolase [Estrella lausannensis]CRX38012.1 Putative 1,4-alpha-glucan branching enzyme [Estrella lausannensis]